MNPQVTDLDIALQRQHQENCSFLLPMSRPDPTSTLVWYTCRYDEQLVLTIEGVASIEDYELLLQSVTYSTLAIEPDKDILNRTLSVYTCSPCSSM